MSTAPVTPQQFQYIKLPDGSYGKFRADQSDAEIHGLISKDFPKEMAALKPQPAAFGQRFSQALGLSQHPLDQLQSEVTQLMQHPGATLARTVTQPVTAIRDLAYGLVTHPIQTVQNLTSGPAFAEDVRSGNYAGAAGSLAGAALPWLAASPQVRMGAAKAAAPAVRATAEAASNPMLGGLAGLAIGEQFHHPWIGWLLGRGEGTALRRSEMLQNLRNFHPGEGPTPGWQNLPKGALRPTAQQVGQARRLPFPSDQGGPGPSPPRPLPPTTPLTQTQQDVASAMRNQGYTREAAEHYAQQTKAADFDGAFREAQAAAHPQQYVEPVAAPTSEQLPFLPRAGQPAPYASTNAPRDIIAAPNPRVLAENQGVRTTPSGLLLPEYTGQAGYSQDVTAPTQAVAPKPQLSPLKTMRTTKSGTRMVQTPAAKTTPGSFADVREDQAIQDAMQADLAGQGRRAYAQQGREFAARSSADVPKGERIAAAKFEIEPPAPAPSAAISGTGPAPPSPARIQVHPDIQRAANTYALGQQSLADTVERMKTLNPQEAARYARGEAAYRRTDAGYEPEMARRYDSLADAIEKKLMAAPQVPGRGEDLTPLLQKSLEQVRKRKNQGK